MDIKLTSHTSNWYEITNNGGANSTKTFHFLQSNQKHFSKVCFGTSHVANFGMNAIKGDRVEKFIAYAAQKGLEASIA